MRFNRDPGCRIARKRDAQLVLHDRAQLVARNRIGRLEVADIVVAVARTTAVQIRQVGAAPDVVIRRGLAGADGVERRERRLALIRDIQTLVFDLLRHLAADVGRRFAVGVCIGVEPEVVVFCEGIERHRLRLERFVAERGAHLGFQAGGEVFHRLIVGAGVVDRCRIGVALHKRGAVVVVGKNLRIVPAERGEIFRAVLAESHTVPVAEDIKGKRTAGGGRHGGCGRGGWRRAPPAYSFPPAGGLATWVQWWKKRKNRSKMKAARSWCSAS